MFLCCGDEELAMHGTFALQTLAIRALRYVQLDTPRHLKK